MLGPKMHWEFLFLSNYKKEDVAWLQMRQLSTRDQNDTGKGPGDQISIKPVKLSDTLSMTLYEYYWLFSYSIHENITAIKAAK